jgi:hypothetical protein
MALHKGTPSGINKPGNKGTGTPSKFSNKNSQADKKLTKKYTSNDDRVAEGVRKQHPNRNVNKLHATNAGGYKN